MSPFHLEIIRKLENLEQLTPEENAYFRGKINQLHRDVHEALVNGASIISINPTDNGEFVMIADLPKQKEKES
jgi:hypothetical protein